MSPPDFPNFPEELMSQVSLILARHDLLDPPLLSESPEEPPGLPDFPELLDPPLLSDSTEEPPDLPDFSGEPSPSRLLSDLTKTSDSHVEVGK